MMKLIWATSPSHDSEVIVKRKAKPVRRFKAKPKARVKVTRALIVIREHAAILIVAAAFALKVDPALIVEASRHSIFRIGSFTRLSFD